MLRRIGVLFSLILIISFNASCTQKQSQQIKGHITLKNTEITSEFETSADASRQIDTSSSTQKQTEEILVQFNGSTQAIKQVIEKYNLQVKGEIKQLGIKLLTKSDGGEKILSKLQQEQVVTRAAGNTAVQVMSDITVTDPHYSKQWNLSAISLPPAWKVTTDSSKVTVAVIDTGVDLDHPHPDLESNLSAQSTWKDFVDDDQRPDDEYGHGTHVAGIIGAETNNDEGIAGINWQVKIMPVRVLDEEGAGSIFQIISGIRWAVDQGADIINLSLGSSFPNKFYQPALDYAYQNGVTVVAAAGNGGYDDYDHPQGNPEVNYPARYNHVLAVGALDSNLDLTDYSNYGRELDFVAPGNNIYSTTRFGYGFKSGTSMAAPHVAGLAALIKASGRAETPDEIKKQLRLTAQDLGAKGRDLKYGDGLINAQAALVDAEITKVKVFAGRQDGTVIKKLSKIVPPTDGGAYNLSAIDEKKYRIYGWLDCNKDDKINAGDYFGSSKELVNSGIKVNLSLQLIIDDSFEPLTLEG